MQGHFQADRKEELLSLAHSNLKTCGVPIKLAWQSWPDTAQAWDVLSKRVETLRHRVSVSPENGLFNYSTFTAIFTHLKVRINHHSYSFFITWEKFWFSSACQGRCWSVKWCSCKSTSSGPLCFVPQLHLNWERVSAGITGRTKETKADTREGDFVRLLKSSNIRKKIK